MYACALGASSHMAGFSVTTSAAMGSLLIHAEANNYELVRTLRQIQRERYAGL